MHKYPNRKIYLYNFINSKDSSLGLFTSSQPFAAFPTISGPGIAKENKYPAIVKRIKYIIQSRMKYAFKNSCVIDPANKNIEMIKVLMIVFISAISA